MNEDIDHLQPFIESIRTAETHAEVRRMVTLANNEFNLNGKRRRRVINAASFRLAELGPETSTLDKVVSWFRKPKRERPPTAKILKSNTPFRVASTNPHPRGMFKQRYYYPVPQSQMPQVPAVEFVHSAESRKRTPGNAAQRRFTRRHPEHFAVA